MKNDLVNNSNIFIWDMVCNNSQQINAEQKNRNVYKKSKFSFNTICVDTELIQKQTARKNPHGNTFNIISSSEKLFSIL